VLGDTQTIVWPDTRDPLFNKLLQRVDAIFDGTMPDVTAGAHYYAAINSITPGGWFQKNIIDNASEHPLTAVAGGHHFYK
jgi:hypothetical protein